MENLSDALYSKPAAAPCSIQLDFSESNDKPTTEELFQELSILFADGLKRFCGLNENGKVDLDAMREKDFMKVREYFLSIGFNVIYNIENLGTFIYRNPKPVVLKDFKLSITTAKYMYVIQFDNYIA